MLKDHLWRLFYRARFYMDAPALYQMLQFQSLRDAYYRELWQEAARNVGAECAAWRFGYHRISRDGMTTVVKQSSMMMDDHLTLGIIGNKALTYELLQDLGCRVPSFRLFRMQELHKAQEFLARQSGPVVVKPASGTGGGRGVTTGVTTPAGLAKASRLAARSGPDLLVEEQLEGDSYRLLYLDGTLIDAVRRDPPVLVGDGSRTIRDLIRIENRKRLSQRPVTALSPLTLDRDCVNRLATLGLAPGSRLEKGRVIEVKRAVNENCASRNHVVTDRVHPSTVALGRRLTTDLGIRFAGVDLLCRDISAPLDAANGCVNEINTTPGIHHHYLVSEPARATPVAELALQRLFETRQGVMRFGGRAATPIVKAA